MAARDDLTGVWLTPSLVCWVHPIAVVFGGDLMTGPKQHQPVKKTAKNKGNPNLGPGPGRPKGSPNKVTKAIKDAAIGALNAGEGAQAFFEERKENSPDAFMGFLKGIVPLDVTVGDPGGNPLVINILPVKTNE